MHRTMAGRRHLRLVLWMAAVTLPIVSSSVPLAQQDRTGPSKPLIPVAASTLASHPDAYYGEPVTLTGAVERNLSRSAFSVDQSPTSNTGNDVLILAPTLNEPPEVNAYVTILGEVLKFEPDEIERLAKDYTLDLDPEVAASFRGRPAVLATAVITEALVNLAMRLPPPLTEEEAVYAETMKRISGAFGALRKGIEGSEADLVKEHTAVLKQALTETEAFWKAKETADAEGWARDARSQAEAIERAVDRDAWDEVKVSAGNLGKACQTCHAAYRERFDDGSFRIKKGTS